jgi:hypothetical protein
MAPLREAAMELRLLNDGPPKTGVRVIGHVRTCSYCSQPAPGITVRITGPQGALLVQTDSDGIYDRVGLPAGHYSVRLDSQDPRSARGRASDEADVRPGEVWASRLDIPEAQP